MWAVENQTPFADNHGWVRDRTGAEVWLVAVRGSFLFHPDGTTSLAEVQLPPCLAPEYRGTPGRSSLLYDTDLPLTKPATDVLIHGHAYAPAGQPTTEVDVTMRVGPVSKTLRVFGDRSWDMGVIGMAMTTPHAFQRMPVVYERAFGGADRSSPDPSRHAWERRNPVGVGFGLTEESLVGRPVPNIEDPRSLIGSWRDRPRPAGFGPIAADWMPRVKWAGRYDEKWERERLPLVPDDFDDRFYCCAPADQQVAGGLKGGEPVELYNLTPEGVCRFHLPRVALGFDTHFSTGERVRHRPQLHSVILEPDLRRVQMVWHAHLPCHPKVLKLQRTVVTQKKVLAWASNGVSDEAGAS